MLSPTKELPAEAHFSPMYYQWYIEKRQTFIRKTEDRKQWPEWREATPVEHEAIISSHRRA